MTRRTSLSHLECSFSSFGDEHLRDELEELRSSTKAELLKSWAEIEELEDEKEISVDRNLELLAELDASREREQALKQQVTDLRRRLGEGEPADQQPRTGLRGLLGRRNSNEGRSSRSLCSVKSSGTSLTASSSTKDNSNHSDDQDPTSRGLTGGLQRQNSQVWVWPNSKKSSISAVEKERIETDFMYQLRDMEQEKRDLISKWETKLDCSQSVLESMEQSRQIQSEALGHLRKQLKSQDHRAYERETELKECVYALRKKVHEKRKFISKQHEKMKEYRSYINDLTAELEKTCVVKCADRAQNKQVPESA